MLTELEYMHYNTCIDAVFNGTHLELFEKDGDHPAEVWDKSGERCELAEARNVTFYHEPSENIHYYIDVFGTHVVIEHYSGDNDSDDTVFSTLEFENGSDEEFFQQSTVTDFSFLEETFLRKLIKLSILIRNNKEVS